MKHLFIILLAFSLCTNINSKIIITELMQSNIDCTMDDINEFPDSWVELYNTENTPEDAGLYSIGESSDPAKAWHLPSQTLSPKRYKLIYCDNTANGFHTDFRLDIDENASVFLFKNGVVVDSISIPSKMPAPNISYGRLNSNSDVWGYQEVPTPNEDNCNNICEHILGEPVFSSPGEVFTTSKAISLTLALPDDSPSDTEIRYTIDGSEPTRYSNLYSSPITINSTKCIRAKLFCKGYLSPRSTTHSYIYLNRDMTLPVISISTNKDYLYNNYYGIYVDGTYNSKTKNYQYDWRRPINFEFFDNSDSVSALNQLCETRISGAASRGCKFKSLAIYANKRFGKKKFKYEFFPDQRPNQKNFKSLVLRNAGNDFDYLYMRDAIAQRTFASHTDIDYQAWQPAIVYINGTYSGILNIRERSNANNIYTNYNELEDVDVVENWNSIKDGDDLNLKAFKAFYNEHNHTWDEYSKWLDLEEFINLWIMNCYFNNMDFPGNNIMMWRPRTEDGRWRFIAKDVDYIMGIYNSQPYNYQYFNWLKDQNFDSSCNWANYSDATRLYRRLLEDEDFKRVFIERFSIYMGDFLNYNHIWEHTWKPMYNTISAEYPFHRKLINQWWPKYDEELSSAQSWLKQRTNFMYQHLSEHFKLGTPIDVIINQTISPQMKERIKLSFNNHQLSSASFYGKIFDTSEITLNPMNTEVSSEDENYTITGWDITDIKKNGTVSTYHINTATLHLPISSSQRLLINATFGSNTSIEDTEFADNNYSSSPYTYSNSSIDPSNATTIIYSTTGAQYTKLTKGINIIKTKNGIIKKVIY